MNQDLEKLLLEEAETCPGRISFFIKTEEQSFELRSSELFRSASLIKLLVLIEAYRQRDEEGLSLESFIEFDQTSRIGGAGVLHALSLDKLTIKDLLTLMIIVSDNTATNLLIDILGFDSINKCAVRLDLEKTKLERKMMDFDAVKMGKENETCAKDVGICLDIIKSGQFLSDKSRQEMMEILKNQQFLDKLPAEMDITHLSIANKTGELPGLEHDAAIIFHGDKYAIAVILIDGLKRNQQGRITISKIGRIISNFLTGKNNV